MLPERVRGAGTFSHFLSIVVDVYMHRKVADVHYLLWGTVVTAHCNLSVASSSVNIKLSCEGKEENWN